MLCFGNHPFEDSAKLRIINANYSIPSTDTQYKVLHNLISKWFHHEHLSLIDSEDIYVYGYYIHKNVFNFLKNCKSTGILSVFPDKIPHAPAVFKF